MHLIVGASGVLGSRLAGKLLEAGERVRAVSRAPERLSGLASRGSEAVRGALLDQDWVARALEGVDRLVIASHGLVPPSRHNTPAAVDGEGARRLIDAAAAAGVQQIVYVSVAGAAQERTDFGRGTETLHWISAGDVAVDIVRALQDATTLGTVRELRGVDQRSRSEVLGILERELGVRARRRYLPLPVVKAARSVTRLVHPGLAVLLDMAIEEIERGGDPSDEPGRATWVGPTTVEDVVRAWVAEWRATAA